MLLLAPLSLPSRWNTCKNGNGVRCVFYHGVQYLSAMSASNEAALRVVPRVRPRKELEACAYDDRAVGCQLVVGGPRATLTPPRQSDGMGRRWPDHHQDSIVPIRTIIAQAVE